MINPNPYSEEESSKTVRIKILDVLFDDRVCSLVYMQDLTQINHDIEIEKAHENLQMANTQISEELQAPQ